MRLATTQDALKFMHAAASLSSHETIAQLLADAAKAPKREITRLRSATPMC